MVNDIDLKVNKNNYKNKEPNNNKHKKNNSLKFII